MMNPLRQAQRFDRSGEYVRRYVPELAGLDPAWIQTPWRLPPAQRVRMGYPGRWWSWPDRVLAGPDIPYEIRRDQSGRPAASNTES